MSYDVELQIDTGGKYPASVTEQLNPTYNLAEMFGKALGISFRALEGQRAMETIPILRSAVADMEDRPEYFQQFNPPNGWGNYEGALETLRWMLASAIEHPKAKWRI